MSQHKIVISGDISLASRTVSQFRKQIRDNVVLFGLVIAFLCLLLRTALPYYPGKYLWMEDGYAFITQAWTLGIHSLWTPYNGYSHLYIRLIAWFCHAFGFDLIWTSHIFLLGWLIAFLITIAVIVVRARAFKLPPPYIYWLVVLVTLQPSYGEVFFHFTNSQWPLGAALGIYLLTRNNDKPSLLELLFIFLLGLSGPFSLFVAPLFLFKEWIEKNLKTTYPLLIMLFLCAITQGILIASTRSELVVEHNTIFASLWLILNALFFNATFVFGITTVLLFIAATLFFWCSILVSFKTLLSSNDKLNSKISLLLLFLFGFICLTMAVFNGLSPLNTLSERYLLIPYTVFFFSAAILSAHSKKILFGVFLSLSFICFTNFDRIALFGANTFNRQFESYVHFSEYDRITIPTLPQSSRFHFDFSAGEPAPPGSLSKLLPLQKPNLYAFSNNAIKTHISNKTILAQTKSSHSYLIFNEPLYCPKDPDIGIKIQLHRNQEGFATLWWGYNKNFIHEQFISYFSPKGDITLYFAFPNSKKETYLAFAPNDKIDTVEIKYLDVYCLPEEKTP